MFFRVLFFVIIVEATLTKLNAKFDSDSDARPSFPDHWGPPPRRQTRDIRLLPAGYGMGSSTLARWITDNMAADDVQVLGGQGPIKKADQAIQNVCDKVKDEVKKQLKETGWQGEMKEFTAVTYSTKVVAGIHYYIKTKIDDDKFVHVRVFKPLPHTGEALYVAAVEYEQDVPTQVRVLVGGKSAPKEADQAIQDMCNEVKDEVEKRLRGTGWQGDLKEFTAVGYRTQIVAGTNYYIKIRIDEHKYVQVHVFKPLPHTGDPLSVGEVEFQSIIPPKKKGKFPQHWGRPPTLQTMDFRPLPGGYGMGSSTIFHWITKNMATDIAATAGPN